MQENIQMEYHFVSHPFNFKIFEIPVVLLCLLLLFMATTGTTHPHSSLNVPQYSTNQLKAKMIAQAPYSVFKFKFNVPNFTGFNYRCEG